MHTVTSPAGRFATTSFGSTTARLLLAKNPAGWAEALPLATSDPVVLAIDAVAADGKDVSWLWDVDYEQLAGRHVICTGPRAQDLAVRPELRRRRTRDRTRPARRPGRAQPGRGRDRHLHPVPGTAEDGGTAMTPAKIVLLYQSLLGIYGDRGNAMVLRERLLRRGIEAVLEIIEPGDAVPPRRVGLPARRGRGCRPGLGSEGAQGRRQHLRGGRTGGGPVRGLRRTPDRRQHLHRRRPGRGDRGPRPARRGHPARGTSARSARYSPTGGNRTAPSP